MAAPTQITVTSIGSYDNVRIVDRIIDESEMGQFFNSARLVDQVLRDARVFSVLMTRIMALLGKPRELEPPKETARAKNIADDIESNWKKMFPHAALAELLTWGIMQGVGIARIDESVDPWKLEVWHPWALVWDPFLRAYYVNTRDGRLNLTKNADGTHTDDQGGRWVLYTPYGYDDPGRRGLLRCVHHLYLERQWSHRDRARYSEIFGQPIRFGTVPAGTPKPDREAFAERLEPVGAEAVIVGEDGGPGKKWGLELVEANGTSNTLFMDTIEQLDKEIATLFLGQHQSTDDKGGLSTTENAGETVLLYIVRGDGDTLGDMLHTQFLVPYCQFAYSAGDMAPEVCWDIEPAEDMAKKASEFQFLITGIVAAKAAALPVDVRELLERHGVPMVSVEEQAKLEAAAAQAAANAKAQMSVSPADATADGGPSVPATTNGTATPPPNA